jgi:Tfp pilus assembly protein PilX
MKMTVHPHSFSRSGASRQRGLVLMLVLIVLGILALAGAAVMRSVDTGNTIAGNHSFQQSALHASERAVADAMAFLPNRVAAGTSGSNMANRYFATRQTVLDARGFPANINWDNVDCVDERGIAVSGTCGDADGGYKVQWVAERMCTSNPTAGSVQSVRAVCEHDVDLASSVVSDPRQIPVHYRVIVRVRGPRNTDNWYEAFVVGPTG